jgi:hypothetical protein
MHHQQIIDALSSNGGVFKEMFAKVPDAMQVWKPAPEKWCLLEILCHLHDEEREDFGARVKLVLETPGSAMSPIDPAGWVKSRTYMEQNYSQMLNKFLAERDQSVKWLRSLVDPEWDNVMNIRKQGK